MYIESNSIKNSEKLNNKVIFFYIFNEFKFLFL